MKSDKNTSSKLKLRRRKSYGKTSTTKIRKNLTRGASFSHIARLSLSIMDLYLIVNSSTETLRCTVVITTGQLHSTKLKFRYCSGSISTGNM